MKQIKVFSMFDGVGGFIVGLNNSNSDFFNATYSNQFEPSRKSQDAYEVGIYQFPDMIHLNTDVEQIPSEKFDKMHADSVEMIVGGFPCQDYSVARSKKHEKGIEGKKGVLFWQIIRATRHIKPKYLILENVDRLLKSPSKQRGRDFAIMLKAFDDLGYSVEWRVINAAEYGRAQRRRRVFFFIYRNDTEFAKKIERKFETSDKHDLYDKTLYDDYIFKDGLFARQFPIHQKPYKYRHTFYELNTDIIKISDDFSGTVWNTGIMRHGRYFTVETKPLMTEIPITLGQILQPESEIDEKYYITNPDKLAKFQYLRGSKKIERTTLDGHKWIYSEGGMSPFDSLDLPARTMLTSEGSINRSTHFLKINDRYRLLTPIEAERLQDFPDDWTRYKKSEDGKISEVSDRMRLFFMGNALVTGIVKRIGDELYKIISES
ncbi:cytosine-specific methyltransferase [Bacilli bacterium]|nr:cytosine-specific methyltransferase [Bacilli bacterium]